MASLTERREAANKTILRVRGMLMHLYGKVQDTETKEAIRQAQRDLNDVELLCWGHETE